MQTSTSSNEVYCTGLDDTFHDPTEITNEQSPPRMSNGGKDRDSDNSKKRKLGPALFYIHLHSRHMLTRSAV